MSNSNDDQDHKDKYLGSSKKNCDNVQYQSSYINHYVMNNVILKRKMAQGQKELTVE